MTTEKTKPSRRTLRKKGRAKRAKRLVSEPEFRKAYFDGKSKRSVEKKSAFRKKKRGKK
ncbi:MAG: hypothetical protein JST04_18400 [Bdellovibrionales bacterium]|nr:hypothetical protein [Bdellovibrionales bacterium]